MALNKLLLLDDVNLLKLLQENGFEDIAHTLENRDVDGKQFLELSEFQTRCWKLPIAEKRNLFNFIKSVNTDPSILLKKTTNSKPIIINKPKPNTPITRKPTLSLKPQLERKPSIENVRITNITEQNDFKQKLGNILDSPIISNTDFSKLSQTENTKPKEPMPLPPEPKQTTTKPVQKDSLNTKSRIMRPLPDEPKNEQLKPKQFLPQPKTAKYFKNTDRSPSPEDEYEDVDKIKEIMDYGYLSPKELELTKKKPDDLQTDDTYEPPPKIKQSAIQKKQFIEEDSKTISLMANRAPIPIPTEINDESDNEMHDYEPIPHHKLKNLRNNMKTIGAYLETETDGEEFLTKSVPDTTSQRIKKYTVQDLENIIIIDEEQSKRSTKIFGTLSKLFTAKPKQSKSDSYVPGTYENHTLKHETPTIEVQKIKPFQNRPLPEIPVNVSPSSSFKRPEKHIIKTKKPEPSTPTKYFMQLTGSDLELNNKNNNELDIISKGSSRKTSIASGSDISSRKSTNENELEINRLSVDSYIDKSIDNEINDLPDYENKNSIRASRVSSQRNSSSPKPFFSDELAAKLAAELKSRGTGFKQKSEKSMLSQISGSNKNFSRIKTPPGSITGDDIDDEPLYGNVEETESDGDENTEQIPEEPVFDNIEDDQPVYGNLDDSNENEEELVNENDQEEEEEEEEPEEESEEYIDSIFNINNEKFYRNTDRKGAKLLLRNLQDGAFLFRPSRRYFLVLTIKYKKKFFNLGIQRTTTNKIRLNADMSSVSPEFGTLRAFVDYFMKEAVTFRDGEQLVEIFLNPILPSDLF